MDTTQLLLAFSALNGVAGHEDAAAAFAAEQLRPFGTVQTTALGSVLCTVREPAPGTPHLLLDAHMDEIGLVVTAIDGESGFLRVGACGGVDRRLLAATPVTVHTAGGAVTGVVSSTPPHLAGDGEKKNPRVEDLYIDVGLDAALCRERIAPGDLVTPCAEPRALLGGQVSGKAMDDRAGCVAHLKALEYLGDTPLSCGVTVLFSTMEEVGCQGATTAAWQVNPTHAIAVDVSFAHTPDARKEKCGELKKGPMIGFAPILNRTMSQDLVAAAQAADIPCQREVMGGRTGTNADGIAATRRGVVTGLLSIPLKYMHTPIETVAVSDVENTGKLIAAYIKATWGVQQ